MEKTGNALKARLRALAEELRFSREQAIVLCVLAVFAVGGGLVAAGMSRPAPVTLKAPRKAVGRKISEPASPRANERKHQSLLVHVAGDVVSPGLYKLKSGSRIADALRVAGGARHPDMLDSVNLAAKVVDGQKILVGTSTPAAVVESNSSGAAGNFEPVNINQADPDDLERLDGVGPVLAKRIISWREAHGSFTSVSQLDQVEGIGPKKFARIKEQVRLE